MCDLHHLHFLQLLATLGFDHTTLLDLLTSPETNFREYLLKYLKLLSQTWTVFQDCSLTFNKISIERKSDIGLDKFDKICMEEKSNMGLVNSVHINTKSGMKRDVTTDRDNSMLHIKDGIQEEKSEETKDYGDNERQSAIAGSGLTMIAGAYDSEDSLNDCSDADELDMEVDQENCDGQKTRTENHGCVKTNGIGIYDVKGMDCGGSIKTEHEDAVVDSDSFVNLSSNNLCDLQSTFLESNDSIKHCDNKSDSVENTSIKDNEILDVEEGNMDSESVLDKALGALIRVRLALERLYAAGLTPFNPRPLCVLIEGVEDLYEQQN